MTLKDKAFLTAEQGSRPKAFLSDEASVESDQIFADSALVTADSTIHTADEG